MMLRSTARALEVACDFALGERESERRRSWVTSLLAISVTLRLMQTVQISGEGRHTRRRLGRKHS